MSSLVRGSCHAGASQPLHAPAAARGAGASRSAVATRCCEGASSSTPKHLQRQHPARWTPLGPHRPLSHRPSAVNSLMGDADHPSSSSSSSARTSTGLEQEQEQLFRSLRLNRHWSSPNRRSLNLLEAGPGTLHDLPEVHVIVFGTGTADHEGVYSHRAMGKDGLPQDTIIGFESKDDAERYACMLEVTMEPHVPHVMHLPAPDLAEFCVERGYQCQVQGGGSQLQPPERNVDLTDWERSQRLRRDLFMVTEAEEAPSSSSSQVQVQVQVQGSEPQQLLDLYLREGGALSNPHSPCSSSEAALDVLRSQLEALLPPPEEEEGSSAA